MAMYLQARRFKFEDRFHILEEFKLIGVSTLIAAIPTIAMIIVTLHLRDVESAAVPTTALYYLADQLGYWWVIWICYAMSWRVAATLRDDPVLLAQYGRGQYGYSLSSVSKYHESVPSSTPSTTTGHIVKMSTSVFGNLGIGRTETTSSTATTSQRVRVDDVLKDGDMVEAFMAHLAHEFSVECLLSLIEFKQFKEFAEREQEAGDQHIVPVVDDQYRQLTPPQVANESSMMSSNIPLSSIVYDAEDSLTEKARKLVDKYICSGSGYEINIAGPLRNQLVEKYKSPMTRSRVFSMTSEDRRAIQRSTKAIASEFDQCIAEMDKLLGYSLSRFTKTMVFSRLQQR